MVKIRDVFVAGGQPSITYVTRSSANLESSLKRAIAKGFHLISLTGPTKVGKTVLCRRIIDHESGIWMTGGETSSEQEFWDNLSYKLDISSEKTFSYTKSTSEINSLGVNVIGLKGENNKNTGFSKTEIVKQSHTNKVHCLQRLSQSGKTLIIDDFHYLEREVQLAIIRALKDKIFDGLTVIVLAVPHRAYDAVRLETEMTGRVTQVKVERWSEGDLSEIAKSGFSELNVKVDAKLVENFVKESRRSPHLMQSFCADACLGEEIYEAQS